MGSKNNIMKTVNQSDFNLNHDNEHIKVFSKQMLKGRLFIGTYEEERYVSLLNSYRSVVTISNEERDLTEDLEIVRRRIEDYYVTEHWNGITTPNMVGVPARYSLWTELPSGNTFGIYWFKISAVKFRNNEAIVKLKIVRSFKNLTFQDEISEPDLITCVKLADIRENGKNFLKNIGHNFLSTTTFTFSNIISSRNVKDAFVFMFLLSTSICLGIIKLLEYSCEFLLKLMRECSEFTKSASPIIIAFINFVGKSVLGLYMLAACLWRDRKVTHYNNINQGYTMRPISSYPLKALPSPRRHNVVIEEVE